MNGSKPSCLYYPTTVLFLDDNRAFLDALELQFASSHQIITLTDPEQAMRTINTNHHDIHFKVLTTAHHTNSDATTHTIDFQLINMLNLLYEKSRFNTISVVVVDYEMPAMNGIKFCEQLAEKNIFKILLTAEADKDIAIKAFNNGTIDKFILKTNDNLHSELTNAVTELQLRYFKKISPVILDNLFNLKNLLNDSAYKQLFYQVAIESKAKEYYLIDSSGSFLFLNEYAKPTWLIMRHCHEIEEQLNLLSGYEFVEEITTSLKNKEKILFLFSEREYKKPVKEWAKFQYKAEKLNEEYLYSVVKNQMTDFIRWDEVRSFV